MPYEIELISIECNDAQEIRDEPYLDVNGKTVWRSNIRTGDHLTIDRSEPFDRDVVVRLFESDSSHSDYFGEMRLNEVRVNHEINREPRDMNHVFHRSKGITGDATYTLHYFLYRFQYLRSYNYPEHYIRHRNYLGELTPLSLQLDRDDAAFRLVDGLAGAGTVSFKSWNYPEYYLRHQDERIKLQRNDDSHLFRNDASFRMVPGLADDSWTSFESLNFDGYFIRHRNFHLSIERGGGDLYRQDCTFQVCANLT